MSDSLIPTISDVQRRKRYAKRIAGALASVAFAGYFGFHMLPTKLDNVERYHAVDEELYGSVWPIYEEMGDEPPHLERHNLLAEFFRPFPYEEEGELRLKEGAADVDAAREAYEFAESTNALSEAETGERSITPQAQILSASNALRQGTLERPSEVFPMRDLQQAIDWALTTGDTSCGYRCDLFRVQHDKGLEAILQEAGYANPGKYRYLAHRFRTSWLVSLASALAYEQYANVLTTAMSETQGVLTITGQYASEDTGILQLQTGTSVEMMWQICNAGGPFWRPDACDLPFRYDGESATIPQLASMAKNKLEDYGRYVEIRNVRPYLYEVSEFASLLERLHERLHLENPHLTGIDIAEQPQYRYIRGARKKEYIQIPGFHAEIPFFTDASFREFTRLIERAKEAEHDLSRIPFAERRLPEELHRLYTRIDDLIEPVVERIPAIREDIARREADAATILAEEGVAQMGEMQMALFDEFLQGLQSGIYHKETLENPHVKHTISALVKESNGRIGPGEAVARVSYAAYRMGLGTEGGVPRMELFLQHYRRFGFESGNISPADLASNWMNDVIKSTDRYWNYALRVERLLANENGLFALNPGLAGQEMETLRAAANAVGKMPQGYSGIYVVQQRDSIAELAPGKDVISLETLMGGLGVTRDDAEATAHKFVNMYEGYALVDGGIARTTANGN